MDRKGLKRGIPLPATIAVSSALGSPRSSLETYPFAKIASMRSPTCVLLDDRLGVPVSLVDDALGLIFVEVDRVLQRSGVLGPRESTA